MVARGASRGRVLYAHWDVRAFRGIERFSDYKKIKNHLRRALYKEAPRGRQRGWRFLLSDKGLTTVIAVGTVVLVLVTVATLIVMLL